MKMFRTTIEIQASAEKVWQILTEGSKYPEWDPGMVRLEGKIALGEKITAYTKISPNRAFPVTVSTLIPNEKMVWTGGMPLGLFKGERTFTLEKLANGRVKFQCQEVFTGLLLPIMGRTIPDLQPTFDAFAAGLKTRAEQG